VGLFLSHVGVAGLMWIFAAMYAVSAVITLFLTVPPPQPGKVVEGVAY